MYRYQLAAAFFALGGAFKDAAIVCLHKLEDIQLSLLISRLVEPGGETYRWILQEHLLKIAEQKVESLVSFCFTILRVTVAKWLSDTGF